MNRINPIRNKMSKTSAKSSIWISNGVKIEKENNGRIKVAFPYYNPSYVSKIKSIQGYRWYPEEKYWSFPNTNGTLEKILKVFAGQGIALDPALQNVITRDKILKQFQVKIPPLLKGDKGGFEDLRRELLSRKYSYKTVKSYSYYNREFLNFLGKNSSEVTDNDIKDYLVYLAEEKRSATSTLNQAINALKFYYGIVLKKKFVYDVKRPRKDRKLPVILSQEEITRLFSSVSNIKHKAILMVVYSAGLRVGEVIRLRPEDIDSQRRLIWKIDELFVYHPKFGIKSEPVRL